MVVFRGDHVGKRGTGRGVQRDGGQGLVVKHDNHPRVRGGGHWERVLHGIGNGAVRVVDEGRVLMEKRLDVMARNDAQARVDSSIILVKNVGVQALEDVDALVANHRTEHIPGPGTEEHGGAHGEACPHFEAW